jgi:hypothetical protein
MMMMMMMMMKTWFLILREDVSEPAISVEENIRTQNTEIGRMKKAAQRRSL